MAGRLTACLGFHILLDQSPPPDFQTMRSSRTKLPHCVSTRVCFALGGEALSLYLSEEGQSQTGRVMRRGDFCRFRCLAGEGEKPCKTRGIAIPFPKRTRRGRANRQTFFYRAKTASRAVCRRPIRTRAETSPRTKPLFYWVESCLPGASSKTDYRTVPILRVEIRGVGPLTFSMPLRRSTN